MSPSSNRPQNRPQKRPQNRPANRPPAQPATRSASESDLAFNRSAPRLYVFGAAGSGTTTLGRALSRDLALAHVDSDDHFWHPTDPPFTHKRTPSERLASMTQALAAQASETDGWVISGACHNWASALVDQADLLVFLTVPRPLRLHRLQLREQARFQDRIREGGDMFHIHQGFMDWAKSYDDATFTGRSRAGHDSWLGHQTKPVCRIDGTPSLSEAKATVLRHLRALEP